MSAACGKSADGAATGAACVWAARKLLTNAAASGRPVDGAIAGRGNLGCVSIRRQDHLFRGMQSNSVHRGTFSACRITCLCLSVSGSGGMCAKNSDLACAL